MNKTLLLTALLASTASYADVYVKGGMSLTPTTHVKMDKGQPGMMGAVGETKIDDQGTGFELGIGYQLTESFAVELGLEKDEISTSYGLGLNARLFKYNKLSMFSTLDVAKSAYDDDILSNDVPYNLKLVESDATKFSLGLGVEYDISETLSVYTSAEWVEYSEVTLNYNGGVNPQYQIDLGVAPNTKMSVGMKYKF